ncbi:Uncharacterised protein [Vibrio cholerae]|nr:Uncharacterised protein [Vibrio cholerae]
MGIDLQLNLIAHLACGYDFAKTMNDHKEPAALFTFYGDIISNVQMTRGLFNRPHDTVSDGILTTLPN